MYYVEMVTDQPWPEESLWRRAAKWLLFRVIPMANPDFEHLYPSVRRWYVELSEEVAVPQREVGFNAEDRPIVLGPWQRNWGFWTDAREPIDAREHRHVPAGAFEEAWQQVVEQLSSQGLAPGRAAPP